MLRWIDGVLLGIAQKFCDKVQMYTGITKFRLEKWAIVLSSSCILGAWALFLPEAGLTAGLVLSPMIIALSVSTVWNIRKIEAQEVEFLKSGRFHVSSSSITYRGFLLTMTLLFCVAVMPPVDAVNLLCDAGYVFLVAEGYFSACIPRPPGKSKFRKWYETALTWLNDQLKPDPIPAPAGN